MTRDHETLLLNLRARFPVGSVGRDGCVNILPALEEIRRYRTAYGETRAVVLLWDDEHQCMTGVVDREVIIPRDAERAGSIEPLAPTHFKWKPQPAAAHPEPTRLLVDHQREYQTKPALRARVIAPALTIYTRRR